MKGQRVVLDAARTVCEHTPERSSRAPTGEQNGGYRHYAARRDAWH